MASAASLLTMIVAGCTGGGGFGSDLVSVRNEPEPYNLEVGQRIADQQCASRGAGRAQFVMVQHPYRSGNQHGAGFINPAQQFYRCTPAGPQGRASLAHTNRSS
jgi:hypothetical protein